MPAKRTSGHIIRDEGTSLAQAAFLDFAGDGVSAATASGVTTVTIPSSVATLFDSTLGAATASIDTGANGVAAGYDMLVVMIVARTSAAVVQSSVTVTVNNDTGANYDRERAAFQNASGAASGAAGATNWAFFCHGDAGVSAYATYIEFHIPFYSETTTFNKVGWGSDGILDDTAGEQVASTYQLGWRSTAAISRVAVTAGSGNLQIGSRMTIKGYS